MHTKRIHPYIYIIMSFLSIVLIGTVLLVMPFASSSGKSFGFVDSFFMATSAVCVTGLSVMPNGLGADMSVYGKIVMCILIEIGGLSIITIAVFFFTIIGAKIGISNRYIIREALNQNSVKGIVKLVRNIVLTSLTIQLIATLINWYPFYTYLQAHGNNNFFAAFGLSLFHSISAFNNAGFDITYSNMSLVEFSSTANVIPQASMITINITTMLLILLGGIGFVVIQDLLKHHRWRYLSLHTKITLITTLILIVVGTLLIKVTSDLGFLESAFTAFTSRTAGFTTWDMSTMEIMYPATYIVVLTLMMVGASPCSTGGGIKTTTIAIIMISVFYFAIGKKPKAFQRKISNQQIFKAFVLMNVAIIIVVICVFLIMIIQPQLPVAKVIFEVISAFSTTGLSLGITTSLNAGSKFVICFLMLFGRIGPLTIIGLLNKNWMNQKHENIDYIEESVIIGWKRVLSLSD